MEKKTQTKKKETKKVETVKKQTRKTTTTKSAKTTKASTKDVRKKVAVKSEKIEVVNIEKPNEKLEELEKQFDEIYKKETKNRALTVALIVVGVLLFFVGSFFLPSVATEGNIVADPVNITEVLEDLKTENMILVLGSTTCPHCQEYKPIVKEFAQTNDIKLHFVEIDTLGDAEDEFLEQLNPEGFEGYVPYTAVYKDGKIVKDTTGYSDEKEMKEFFKEAGLIK